MTYTAYNGKDAQLALATSARPASHGQRKGIILPAYKGRWNVHWTKSGAILPQRIERQNTGCSYGRRARIKRDQTGVAHGRPICKRGRRRSIVRSWRAVPACSIRASSNPGPPPLHDARTASC